MTSTTNRAWMMAVVVAMVTVAAQTAGAQTGGRQDGRDGHGDDRDGHESPQAMVCSADTLDGGYTFSITGVNFNHGIQYVLVGQFTTDGVGALIGKGTQSIQGSVSRQQFAGVYQVDPDCSGTATITFQQGVSSSMDFFIAKGGREVRLITTGAGTLETGTATRVATRRR